MVNPAGEPESSVAPGDHAPHSSGPPTEGGGRLLISYPWLTYLLPIVVFLGVGSFEPTADHDIEFLGLAIPYDAYPVVYAIKIALTMAAMAVAWPGYKQFPCRISPLAVAVGLVGAVVYVGLCKLEFEGMILPHVGLGWLADYGARSGFDPWTHWPQAPHWAEGYLALRFWGLVVIVPIIEEFFLRGLVMRYFIAPDWWNVPFGTLTSKAAIIGTLVPVIMHPPTETLAAAAWFTLITWLMFKTRNIWDCVLAHGVTNLGLGVYVLASGDWYLL